MDQLYLWRPAPDLGQKLRYALTTGLPKDVKRLVAHSRGKDTSYFLPRDRPPTTKPTLIDVYQRLHDAGDRVDDRAAQLDLYLQVIDRDVTGPLFEQAGALSDPAAKARAIAQARYLGQQLKFLPGLGLGLKPPRQTGSRLLSPEAADNFTRV